jgi:hypothetical protein
MVLAYHRRNDKKLPITRVSFGKKWCARRAETRQSAGLTSKERTLSRHRTVGPAKLGGFAPSYSRVSDANGDDASRGPVESWAFNYLTLGTITG